MPARSLRHPDGVGRTRPWTDRPDGIPVLVTLHPSALLRGEPDQREREFGHWVADLRVAAGMLTVR